MDLMMLCLASAVTVLAVLVAMGMTMWAIGDKVVLLAQKMDRLFCRFGMNPFASIVHAIDEITVRKCLRLHRMSWYDIIRLFALIPGVPLASAGMAAIGRGMGMYKVVVDNLGSATMLGITAICALVCVWINIPGTPVSDRGYTHAEMSVF